jgi:putative oxidoreductase
MTTVDSSNTVRTAGVTTVMSDLVLLLARVGLGVMMIAHAKVEYDYGGSLGGVVNAFAQSGIPLPAIAGPVNLFGELIGGALLILGFGVPVIGVLMAVNMLGAWIFVHTSGLFAFDRNGPELVIALGLLSLVLAVTGSGRFGLDHLVAGRARRNMRVRKRDR